MITDQIGLSILQENKSSVFQCHKNYHDGVIYGEIAASQLILSANYQIATLQMKYQGVDFRKKEKWNCSHRISPIFVDRAIDGISHDPYELIFVKFKGRRPFDTNLER